MKKIILLTFLSISLGVQCQFLEIDSVIASSKYVIAKDYNGYLYASTGQLFRKEDNADANWELVYSGVESINVCITDRHNYPRFIHDFGGSIKKSYDGINWITANLSGVSGSVQKMIYTENGSLFAITQNKTYISTDAGNSFSTFYAEPITCVEYDSYTNRYIFVKEITSTSYQALALSATNNSVVNFQHNLAFASYAVPMVSVSLEGTFYITSNTSFSYIYQFLNGEENVTEIYPVAGMDPLHPRGLVSTKTGRTFVGSWGFGLLAVEDDTLHYNFNRPTLYQYSCENLFFDRDGFLYYNFSNQNVPQGYIKSAFSTRQPVYFQRMEDIDNNRAGKFVRTDNDVLLCVKSNGETFKSTDDGENWNVISPVYSGGMTNATSHFSKHPSGKLFYTGAQGPLYSSHDNGDSWQSNSTLGGQVTDIAYSKSGDVSLLVTLSGAFISVDTFQTATQVHSITTHHPTYGFVRGNNTGLITEQNTILLGGRINQSFINRSTDNGQNWEEILPAGIYHQNIWDLYEDSVNHKIWLASDSGLFWSVDDGLSFMKDNTFPGRKPEYITRDADNNLVVTSGVLALIPSATFVNKNGEWQRISFGHNWGIDNMYYDEESGYIFGSGYLRSGIGDPQILNIAEESISKLETNLLDIFPNPALDHLTISLPSYSSGTLKIIDLDGRIMFKRQINSSEDETVTINLDHISSGIYIISLITENQKFESKFVKI